MKTRILTAVLGVPLLIGIVYLGGWFLAVGVLALSLIGLYEYIKCVNTGLEFPINPAFVLFLGFCLWLIMRTDYYSLSLTLVFLLMVCLMYEVFTDHHFMRVALTVFGLVYIPIMFGYLMLIPDIRNGNIFIWMVFVAAFSTDTFAYFVGRMIGGKKLAPVVSPKKTVSGSIGGIVGCILCMLLYGYIVQTYFMIDIPFWTYGILGFVASVVGQLGDLSASMIKREYAVKDYGKILPGHGGVLDRFDSVLFITPVIYLFTVLTSG